MRLKFARGVRCDEPTKTLGYILTDPQTVIVRPSDRTSYHKISTGRWEETPHDQSARSRSENGFLDLSSAQHNVDINGELFKQKTKQIHIFGQSLR